MKTVKSNELKPFWNTNDHKTVILYQGNCTEVLRRMEPKSVQCIITSPPYWNLRDYETTDSNQIGTESKPDCLGWITGDYCWKCYVCHLIEVFKWARRVLRDDGVLWLNLGDTYSQSNSSGVKPGNLIGVPWKVAFALQANGWCLRQDIIWSKPGCMPESVEKRCTKSHEYIFLLTKDEEYYFDNEAIKEDAKSKPHAFQNKKKPEKGFGGANNIGDTNKVLQYVKSNKRSVWTISSESYSGQHFASFPTKLVEVCLLSSTSEYGSCSNCGTPFNRVVGKETIQTRKGTNSKYHLSDKDRVNSNVHRNVTKTSTITWEQGCSCNIDPVEDVQPCVVLDPFIGSGTTCAVALGLNRYSIGIDLSDTYLSREAITRIKGEALGIPDKAHLVTEELKPKFLGKKL